MENASKALVMAGGVLIALMIIGALILMFNNLTNYQKTDLENNRNAQVVDFNNQYETFNRNGVRGNEIVSLANKILDYNTRKTEQGYMPMEISIKIGDNKVRKKFAYEDIKLINLDTYNKDTIKQMLDKPKSLENKYGLAVCEKISSNIANILVSDTNKAMAKIKEIIPKATIQELDTIKNEIAVYYEYTQLKRAYFDCKGVEYDQNTGRITKMNFEFNNKFN